jgi:hypothetical protein
MKILNFNHPKDVGFTYYDHLKFTWKESILALGMSLVMFKQWRKYSMYEHD